MVNDKTKTFIKTLKSQARKFFVLYLAAGLIFIYGTDLYRMKVKAINHVLPQSVKDIVTFSLNPDPQKAKFLEKYLSYYKMVVKAVPDSAVDHAMLGYCYYFLGDIPRAIMCYRKAIAILPEFFWFHYNLGMIYIKTGRYDEGNAQLQKAVKCSPQAALEFYRASKTYANFGRVAQDMNYNFEQNLANRYRMAHEVIMLCQYKITPDVNKAHAIRIF